MLNMFEGYTREVDVPTRENCVYITVQYTRSSDRLYTVLYSTFAFARGALEHSGQGGLPQDAGHEPPLSHKESTKRWLSRRAPRQAGTRATLELRARRRATPAAPPGAHL